MFFPNFKTVILTDTNTAEVISMHEAGMLPEKIVFGFYPSIVAGNPRLVVRGKFPGQTEHGYLSEDLVNPIRLNNKEEEVHREDISDSIPIGDVEFSTTTTLQTGEFVIVKCIWW